jgi:hypothetical protein
MPIFWPDPELFPSQTARSLWKMGKEVGFVTFSLPANSFRHFGSLHKFIVKIRGPIPLGMLARPFAISDRTKLTQIRVPIL